MKNLLTVGTKIRIVSMKGEPQYSGKEGVIKRVSIDPWGDVVYDGTWGGCSVYPKDDIIEVITDEKISVEELAQEVTGTVGQILDECELSAKAQELLEELYQKAVVLFN